jgi:hypothetical protein
MPERTADARQDIFEEALIKVRLKIAFAPLSLGGAGEGRSYGKEKNKLLPCEVVFGVSTRSLPSLTPPTGRGIYF